MAKEKSIYRCTECGWTSPKWLGQCRECQQWNSMEEVGPTSAAPGAAIVTPPRQPALPINDISSERARSKATGIGEFDRVLGGGIVPGAVILLAGEPGIGKSTLLLEVASTCAAQAPVLYITGEESASQVRGRAERIGALHPQLFLADETSLSTALGHIESTRPSLVIVDSVQTLQSDQLDGSAGSVAQVRAVASALIRVAKERSIPILLVGHVTKDGGIAGPRLLEHLVDVVCQFEGDRHTRLRLLRAVKNRYGPTDEVGCFELSDTGITGLTDPSGLFLSQSQSAVPGSCVTVTLEGRRPLPTEIQALVAHTSAGSPRRTTVGVDHSRVAMILAVLQARLGIDTSDCDVYASTVGGARISEPAADLATAIGIVSAMRGTPTRSALIAFGEVGLTGEVRACTGVKRRVQEAARLGFTTAIIPAQGCEEAMGIDGITVLPISDLAGALRAAIR